MSRAARIESVRANLAAEAESKNWEWNFVSELLLISMEMKASIDDILEWSIMRYNIVRQWMPEYYEEIKQAQSGTSGNITLG